MPVRSEVFGVSTDPSPSQHARRVLDEAGCPLTVEEIMPRMRQRSDDARGLPAQFQIGWTLRRRDEVFVEVEPGLWWLADQPPRRSLLGGLHGMCRQLDLRGAGDR